MLVRNSDERSRFTLYQTKKTIWIVKHFIRLVRSIVSMLVFDKFVINVGPYFINIWNIHVKMPIHPPINKVEE